MPVHSEEKTLPYTAAQLFALVSDIEKYPEFLPWCKHAHINEQDGNILFAELVIKFGFFQERYMSRVELNDEQKEISVSLVQGPFKHLQNEWKFVELGNGQTRVSFDIDFEFNSHLLETMIGSFFDKALFKMMSAFEERAAKLYVV